MRIAVATITVAIAVAEIALLDALDAGELLPGVERDQRHALRRAAHLAELGDAGADQYAPSRDQHHLIVVVHQNGADHLAVPLGSLDRDHALAAAPVAGVLAKRRAFAEAVLRGGEHTLGFIVGREHAHHALTLAQPHAAHAGRLAPHGTHIGFLEAHRFALGGEKHDVILAVGQRGADE